MFCDKKWRQTWIFFRSTSPPPLPSHQGTHTVYIYVQKIVQVSASGEFRTPQSSAFRLLRDRPMGEPMAQCLGVQGDCGSHSYSLRSMILLFCPLGPPRRDPEKNKSHLVLKDEPWFAFELASERKRCLVNVHLLHWMDQRKAGNVITRNGRIRPSLVRRTRKGKDAKSKRKERLQKKNPLAVDDPCLFSCIWPGPAGLSNQVKAAPKSQVCLSFSSSSECYFHVD